MRSEGPVSALSVDRHERPMVAVHRFGREGPSQFILGTSILIIYFRCRGQPAHWSHVWTDFLRTPRVNHNGSHMRATDTAIGLH